MANVYQVSEGAKLFAEFLKLHGLSDAVAGKALGVTDVTVYHWRIGAKIPKDLGRKKIEVFTCMVDGRGALVEPGIAPSAWDDGSELDELQRVQPYRVANRSSVPPAAAKKRRTPKPRAAA